MKWRYPCAVLVLFSAGTLISCLGSSSSSSTATSGTGHLWLTAQGNDTVQAYTIDPSSGGLSLNGSALATGGTPSAILLTPKADALFVANAGAGSPATNSGISAYAVGSDGTLKAAGSLVSAGPSPKAMAINPAGTFLFVTNQGTFDLTQPGSISVFAVSGTSLTQVAGSPFPTEAAGATTGTGPVSVAVSASGNYLYVANQFSNTLSSFQIASSGALTPSVTYAVGNSPSAVFISAAQGTVPAGQFLYVANTGSNSISAFSICDVANGTGCSTPNGFLAPVAGSPFPTQPGPVAIAMDPSAAFFYVADSQANQVSEYSWSSSSGALTALSTATISTGGDPVSLAIRGGVSATTTTAGQDYLYVANLNGSSLSAYSLNTTTGALNVLGTPVSTFSQPSAVTAR